MVEQQTPPCTLGWKATDFSLPGVDGKTYRLADIAGRAGTLIMFICNHCPYVQAIIGKIVDDVAALKAYDIGAVAIMPNDTEAYPADSFDAMKDFAAKHRFGFPYVIDHSQDVARSYGAVCTPDFFGFNGEHALQYRGRLDASGHHSTPATKRELRDAMIQVATTGRGPRDQLPSIGCSIKWRAR